MYIINKNNTIYEVYTLQECREEMQDYLWETFFEITKELNDDILVYVNMLRNRAQDRIILLDSNKHLIKVFSDYDDMLTAAGRGYIANNSYNFAV